MQNKADKVWARSRRVHQRATVHSRLGHAARMVVESLETRVLLSAISWKGGTGDWNDPTKWSGGVVPINADQVTIPAGATVTVSDSESYLTLTTAAGSTLDIASTGMLNAYQSATISGSVEDDGTWFNSGTSTVTFNGTTTVKGNLAISTIINDGQMSFDGGNMTNGANSFTNNATVNVTGGLPMGSTTFTNNSSATFDMLDDSGFRASEFLNMGMFEKTGGTGTAINYFGAGLISRDAGIFEDVNGTINIQSGKFVVGQSADFNGTHFEVSSGASFDVNTGDPTDQPPIRIAGTVTGAGAGHVHFDTGLFIPQDQNSNNVPGTLNFADGVLKIAGANFQNSTNNITNAGFMDFIGSTPSPTVLDNAGTIRDLGTVSLDFTGGTFTGEAGSVIDLAGDVGITGAVNFNDMGEIIKSAGTGTSIINVSYPNLIGAPIDIDSGTLSFESNRVGYSAGPLTIATGATLNFDTSNAVGLSGNYSVTGGGTVTLTSGFLDGPESYWNQNTSVPAVLNFAPNTFFVQGSGFLDDSGNDNLVNAGSLYEDENGLGLNATGTVGNFSNSGTVYLNGQLEWEKGATVLNRASGIIDFNGPTSIFLDVINRFDNKGTILADPGAGNTLDMATPFIADFVNNNVPSLMNTGTVEVQSGTLLYPSISMGANGVLTGGGYKLDPGTTLTTDNPLSLSTNNGTVILGANSSFADIAPLSTNNGTFRLLPGASFTTAGSLLNSGTLNVGGTLVVNGDLAESGASSDLKFSVGGAPGSSDAPALDVVGQTSLAGNLSAVFSNGFAAPAGTAYDVANFGNPESGSFASTAGVGPDFTAGISANHISLDSTVVGTTDLAVSNISAPSTFTPGQTANISYTVTNVGSGIATGPWTDSIFFSPNGAIGAKDILLGTITHNGSLNPSASYNGSTSVTFPSVGGAYVILVETDSGLAIPDVNRGNNIAISAPTNSNIPILPLNGSVNGTITGGQTLIYQLTVPGGADIHIVDAQGVDGQSDLEVLRGAVPTPTTAQLYVPASASSGMLQTIIPSPQPGVYYVSITGQAGIASSSFSLSAAAVTRGVFSVSPGTFGQGPVTLTIGGAGFNADSVVQLLNGSNAVVATATSSSTVSPNQIDADLDLGSVSPGTYTVAVITNSHTDTLANSVTVAAATSTVDAVHFTESGPADLRNSRVYQLTITYTNTSNVDVPAPMMMIEDPELAFQIAGGDPGSKIIPGLDFSQEFLGFLAINQEGDAGVLPPGYTGQILINFQSLDSLGDFTVQPTVFDLGDAIDPATNQPATTDLGDMIGSSPFDISQTTAEILAAQLNGLDALPTTSVPASALLNNPAITGYPLYNDTVPGLTAEQEATEPGAFSISIPVSNKALQLGLDHIASVLSQAGTYEIDYDALLGYAAQAADNFGQVTQRQTDGIFGYGVPDPLTYKLTQDVDAFQELSGFFFLQTPFGFQSFFETAPNTFIAYNAGDTSTMVLDSANNQYVITEPAGQTLYFPVSTTGVSTISHIVNPNGTVETFNRNGSGQVTSLDDNGLTATYAYNADGVITSSTDAFGNVTTYGYQVTSYPVPNSSLSAAATEAFPFLSTITSPAGTTTITYNTQPQLEVVKYLDDARTGPSILGGVTIGIDDNAFYNLSPATIGEISSITLPDGSGQKYSYDAFGRVIKTTLLDGSDPITNSYDSTGLVETTTYADGSVISATLNYNGQPIKIIDLTGKTTILGYNPAGLLTSILAPLGQSSTATYTNDSPTQIVDGDGNTSTLTLNADQQPITITDPNGNVIGLAYNGSAQLTTVTYPNLSTTQYQYNGQGNASQITEQNGITESLSYDGLQELTGQSYSNGSSYSYGYSQGHLVSASGSGGSTAITVNAAGYVTESTDPNGHVVNYTYNAQHLMTQISDASGVIENYTYDADARLSTIHDGSNNLIAQYAYDVDGRISMVTYGNGTKTVYSYDADSRIASITNLSPSSTVTFSQTYTYNGLNLPITMTDQNGHVTSYAYDQANQLTQVNLPSGQTITYAYDADGNRSSVTNSGAATNYTVNNMDQYVSAGTTTFSYDANGNLTSQTGGSGTTTYTYNDFGRLASASGSGGNFTYSYDSLGVLDAYTLNGVKTTFERSATGSVIAAFNASGNLISHFVYGDGLVGAFGGTAGTAYYQSDLTGNITATTGSSGSVVNTYSYLPFGEVLSSTGSASSFFTYNGADGVMNLGDGFYQAGNRTYDPTIGRFIQPDPTGIDNGLNLYTYAGNAPTALIDPDGTHEEGATKSSESSEPSGTGQAGGFVSVDHGIPGASVEAPEGEAGAHAGAKLSTYDDGSYSVTVTVGAGASAGSPVKTGLTTAEPEGSGVAPVAEYSQWTPAGGGTLNIPENQTENIIAPGQGSGVSVDVGASYTGRTSAYYTIRDGYKNVGPRGQQLIFGQGKQGKVRTGLNNNKKFVFATPTHLFLVRQQLTAARRLAKIQGVNFKQLGIEGTITFLLLNHFDIDARLTALLLLAGDPNDIQGPGGFGAGGYVTGNQPLPYRIDFTNETTASAPAQDVVVSQQLSSNLDWTTFQLSSFGFGKYTVNVPAGLMSYSTRVNATSTTGLYVDVSASFNPSTGVLTWTFTSIDSHTLTPADSVADDAAEGFLPPDNANGRGEGYVSYTVSPKAGAGSGTIVNAQATVVFDTNAPINTKTIANTLDRGAPTSSVTALASAQANGTFNLSWSGQDDVGGSGIASYNIYVSTDGGAFQPLLIGTTSTSTAFAGQPGHSYAFYSIATDNVGNVQPTPQAAQASTTVLDGTAIISGNVFDILGTTGNDTIVVSVSGLAILTTINGAAQTPQLLTSFTGIEVEGGEGNDSITLEAGVPLAVVLGGAGSDTIIADNANDTLIGGANPDSIQGGTGNNLIKGGQGPDTLVAGSGNDTLRGQAGSDSLTAGAGAVLMVGGAGADTLVGAAGGATLAGGPGNDSLSAVSGDNLLLGDADSDTLVGGSGADTLIGGGSTDSLTGGSGPNLLLGGPGGDILVAGSGAQTLIGGAGGDVLTGGPASDCLQGGQGPDTLVAGSGNNTLLGNSGLDSLTGGMGNNLLAGGPGADTIEASTDPVSDFGIDTILGGLGINSVFGTGGGDSVVV